MIPPHDTISEQAEYLEKLAASFITFFARGNGEIIDEFPWGDVIPLRAIAKTLRTFPSVSSTNHTMPRYKVTAVEIHDEVPAEAGQIPIVKELEVYSQTLPELNISVLIRALNPTQRKRRSKKEVAS